MTKFKRGTKITDETDCIHILDKKIGEGGQGVVWINKEQNRIVLKKIQEYLSGDSRDD